MPNTPRETYRLLRLPAESDGRVDPPQDAVLKTPPTPIQGCYSLGVCGGRCLLISFVIGHSKSYSFKFWDILFFFAFLSLPLVLLFFLSFFVCVVAHD